MATAAAMVLGVTCSVGSPCMRARPLAEATPAVGSAVPSRPLTETVKSRLECQMPGTNERLLEDRVCLTSRADRNSTDATNWAGVASLQPTSASREMLRRATEQLSRQARGHVECAREVGVRLLGVRPSGALGVIGLKNGDRIVSLNGYAIERNVPPEKLQALTQTLLKADSLTFHLNRRGRDTTLSVSVQDVSYW